MADIEFKELIQQRMTARDASYIGNLLVDYPDMVNRPGHEFATHVSISEIFKSGGRIFIALDGERIVGVVLLTTRINFVGRQDAIEGVLVASKYRGRGIAATLLDMAEEASQARGALGIESTVKEWSIEMKDLFLSRGYVQRSLNVTFYKDLEIL